MSPMNHSARINLKSFDSLKIWIIEYLLINFYNRILKEQSYTIMQ